MATALARADAADAVKRDFEARHQQQFGFLMAGKPLVVQSVSAEAWVYASDVKEPLRPQAPTAPDPSTGVGVLRFAAIYADVHIQLFSHT